MIPVRIQRKRVKGWKMPPNTVSVTRPGRWGNPFKVGTINRDPNSGEKIKTLKNIDDVLKWYKNYLKYRGMEDTIIKELKGKNLACFCKIGEPCHADILLKIANQ
jgi:hypothetical protein